MYASTPRNIKQKGQGLSSGCVNEIFSRKLHVNLCYICFGSKAQIEWTSGRQAGDKKLWTALSTTNI